MEILTDYDNEVYKTQVMNSPEGSLFKQWASPLNRLQREKGEISVMDIWQTSTQCIEKLYQAGGNKIDEIPFIYTSLIKECSIIKQGRNTINRTRAEAEASAQLIMTVTATRSLNYIQPGHEEDPVSENDGKPLTISMLNSSSLRRLTFMVRRLSLTAITPSPQKMQTPPPPYRRKHAERKS